MRTSSSTTERTGMRIRSRRPRGVLTLFAITTIGLGTLEAFGASDRILGHYEIVETQRFRGGLTSDEFAKELVGTKPFIGKALFTIRDVVIKNPIYRFDTVSLAHNEGDFSLVRTSAFYGFRTDRKAVDRLLVFKSNASKEPIETFELLDDGRLLEMYDGHFYFLTKRG